MTCAEPPPPEIASLSFLALLPPPPLGARAGKGKTHAGVLLPYRKEEKVALSPNAQTVGVSAEIARCLQRVRIDGGIHEGDGRLSGVPGVLGAPRRYFQRRGSELQDLAEKGRSIPLAC